MSSTEQIDLTDGRAAEIKFPDGSVLRVRWENSVEMVKVTAETINGAGASQLTMVPWAANCVMIKAEV